MKRFWNYIFYFTWKLHCVIGINIVEKPLKYILGGIPIFARNLKKGEKIHRNVLDNPEYGFNISFAYRWMLFTGTILFSCFISLIIILFNFYANKGVGVKVSFFLGAILSYLFNRFFLGWHKDTYIKYFQEFQKSSSHTLGYISTLFFHLGMILFGLLIIFYCWI